MLLRERLHGKGSLGKCAFGSFARSRARGMEVLRCFKGGLCQLRASGAPVALMGGRLGFPVFSFEGTGDSVLALETSSSLGTGLLKIIELARISQELCYPSTVPGQMPNCGVQVRVKTPGSVRCRSDCCQVPGETA